MDIIHKSTEELINFDSKNKKRFINKKESHSHYIKAKFQLTIVNKLIEIKNY